MKKINSFVLGVLALLAAYIAFVPSLTHFDALVSTAYTMCVLGAIFGAYIAQRACEYGNR